MKVAIVIPAYNEEKSIAKVLKEINEKHEVSIIVVDDCSSDATSRVSTKNGAYVVTLKINSGYNVALHAGINVAIEQGYTHCVTMDADGQHPPELISDFIKYFKDEVPFVFGCRENPARWGEKIFSIWTNWIYGLVDPLCGMKGYDLRVLNSGRAFPSYDSVGTELLMWVLKKNYLWKQIKVPQIDRKDVARFGSGIRPNLLILSALIA
jgi:glycosyltransferase involved in cell wall biosynthesis